jgi:methionyl-tRNA synthetase
MSNPVLTAVAWPYANGPRHIGHVSGFGVPSDVFSRYMRMAGHKVLMVSGTDEHGTPIQVQADKENATPQATVDKYARQIGGDLQGLGLSYDLFTRTTTGNHYKVVQDLFSALWRNGYVVP